MGRLLIRHADIITLDEDQRLLFDADIAVTDGAITAVGAAPPEFRADETFDAAGCIVMPGMFNAYTHSPLALFRGRAPSHALDRWLDDRDWLIGSGLTPEDVYWGSALAACEMIRSGVVGFADQYFYMDRVAEIVVQSGMRANLAWCTFGSEAGEVGTDLAGVAAFVEQWQGAGEGRIQTAFGPFSPDMCSPVFLARTAAVAARLGVGIHLHVAESRQKLEQSLKLYDMTPVEVMNRNGVFDVPVLAAHCIYVTETDREILASRGVTAVFCPTYQMRRGVGHTPVEAFEASGVPVVLGTERPTVSGRLDVLQEMRLAALLRQSSGADAGSGMDQAALRMAARDSAQALGFGMSGVVSPGHAADLIFIDRRSAHLPGGHLLADLVLYSVLSSDVSDVMVAGKWLMRDRKLLTLDEEEIRREAGVRGQRLMADTKF